MAAVVVCHFARGAVPEEVLAQLHATDAQGSENLLPHQLVVGFSRNGLDDSTQHAVAKVGIGVGRARIEIQRPAHRVANDFLGVNGQRDSHRLGDFFGGLGSHRVERFVAVPSGRVLQAVPYGNLVPARVQARSPFQMRLELQNRKHPLVKAEFALFDQPQYGRGGEGLTQAGDAKQGSGPHRFVLFQIGIAEAAGVDQATVIGDGQGGAGWFVLAHERGHQIVIGGQRRHDEARDLATGPLTALPQGDPRGGRGQEPAARQTRP